MVPFPTHSVQLAVQFDIQVLLSLHYAHPMGHVVQAPVILYVPLGHDYLVDTHDTPSTS